MIILVLNTYQCMQPGVVSGAIMSRCRRLLMWYKTFVSNEWFGQCLERVISFHQRLIPVNVLLQYGVKIIVMTSFENDYCIEILPKFRTPKRGKRLELLDYFMTCEHRHFFDFFGVGMVGSLKFLFGFCFLVSYLVLLS